MSLEPVPALQGARPYSPPKHPAPVWLKLDANEGPPPPIALVAEALRDVALNRYPSARDLEADLAKRYGIGADQVLVTAGADEAIDRLCRAMLEPGRRVAMTWPTFEMIPKYAALTGASIDRVAWQDEAAFPLDAMLAAITPDTRLVVVVTPNAPTGALVPLPAIEALSKAAPHAALLVDMAYAEFAPEDIAPAVLALPNTVMTRTFSKAYGIAGARVGYAAGNADIIGWMRAAGGPYAVAAPSLAIARRLLSASAGAEAPRTGYVELTHSRAERLRAALVECGVKAADSFANFVLARTPRALWLRDGLAGHGIAVRAFPGHAELADAVRMTVPARDEDVDILARAIRSVLRPGHVELCGGLAHLIGGLALPHDPSSPHRWRVMGPEALLSHPLADEATPLCFAPHASAEEEHALLAAGAARVLRTIDDLKEILP